MYWIIIKMSSGVRIRNLPDIVNVGLITNFLTPVTSEVERIEIKGNYADVFLKDEDDLDSILMLNGMEILGYAVEITKLNEESDETLPEILIEEHIIPRVMEMPKEPLMDPTKCHAMEPVSIAPKEQRPQDLTGKVENSQQLRVLLQEISLKPRRQLDENHSFRIIMNCKLAALVTMFTLIALTFADIFG